MPETPPDPNKNPQAQESNEEDYFIFMGKRIPLPPDPGKKAKDRETQQALPTSEQTAASASRKHEPLQSSKSSFDLEPLAQSSKTSSTGHIFLFGGGLLLVAVIVLFLWHRFGSTEAQMFGAASAGQLVVPQGTSSFDLYRRLKTGGISPVTTERLKSEVLPKLSDAGAGLLKKVHDGDELPESEQEQLVHIYEFAADIDSQDDKLLARRAYAAAYRAASRKADKEAFASLREAFQSDSQWALPFRDVARLYARAGNYQSAEYFYQQTLQLEPKWALAALELGTLAFDNKRLAEAEIAYRRATDADPTLPAAWARLGSLYEIQKKKAEAIGAYERALQLAELRPSSYLTADEIKRRLESLR
jgi:tetratricopeptide (TPR) repeat protein